MFAMIAGNRELTKRTLSADDIRAVCSIYPDDQDPHDCTLDMPEDGCGCRTGAGGGLGTSGAGVLYLLAAAFLIRSRRARRADRG